MHKTLRTFIILDVVVAIVAIIRYFLKSIVQSMGISETAGSFIASITVVTLIGLVIFYAIEGRAPKGTYIRASLFFAGFVIWCQALVIAGILLAARTGADTYYSEFVLGHKELSPIPHALSHLGAGIFVIVVGLILGTPVYFVARRGRAAAPAAN